MLKIVVIFDDAAEVESVKHIIDKCTFAEMVGCFYPNDDAIIKTLRTNPDILITDTSLSKINGLELTREIKEMVPEISVILISGDGSHAEKAYQLGVSGYIVRPIAPDRLLRAILRSGPAMKTV